MNAFAAASRSDVSSMSLRTLDTVGSNRQAAAGRESKSVDDGLRKIAKRVKRFSRNSVQKSLAMMYPVDGETVQEVKE